MPSVLVDPAAVTWVKATLADGVPIRGFEEAEFAVGYLPPMEAKRLIPTIRFASGEWAARDRGGLVKILETETIYHDASWEICRWGVREWRGVVGENGSPVILATEKADSGGRQHPVLTYDALAILEANMLLTPLAIRVYMQNTLSSEEKKRFGWPLRWSASGTSAAAAPPAVPGPSGPTTPSA